MISNVANVLNSPLDGLQVRDRSTKLSSACRLVLLAYIVFRPHIIRRYCSSKKALFREGDPAFNTI